GVEILRAVEPLSRGVSEVGDDLRMILGPSIQLAADVFILKSRKGCTEDFIAFDRMFLAIQGEDQVEIPQGGIPIPDREVPETVLSRVNLLRLDLLRLDVVDRSSMPPSLGSAIVRLDLLRLDVVDRGQERWIAFDGFEPGDDGLKGEAADDDQPQG